MKPTVVSALQSVGLHEEAGRVYLACLALGKAKAQAIAKHARMNRSAVYRHLDELSERGLVHPSIVSGVRVYAAGNPTQLTRVLMERQRDLESALPALLELYAGGKPGRPQLRFYADVAGIRTVLEEVLLCADKRYRHFGSYFGNPVRELLDEDELKAWTRRRLARGVSHRVIWPMEMKQLAGKIDPMFTRSDKELLRECRYAPIPAELPVLIYLFDEKAAFICARPEQSYAAVLESKDVHDSLGAIFELVWSIGEPAL